MRKLQVLMLEDSADDAALLAIALRKAGIDCDWRRAETKEGFLAGLEEHPDIVLSDYSLPGFDALQALSVLAETEPEIPVIVVTGVMSEEACVESLRRGAIDYLLKDRLTRLGPAVEHALSEQRLQASRRQAEQEARWTAAMLREVVENSPSAIYVKDRDGRYIFGNARLEEVLGLEPGSAVGRTDADLLPAARAQRLAELDRACLERNQADQRQEEFGGDGERRTYLSNRYPIQVSDEIPEAVGGAFTDITELKHTERDLRAARAELREQADLLERNILDLQDMDRVKAEFLESVSHELRTPLSLINGTIEMLVAGEVGKLTPEERELVASMEQAGSRLYATILDLLTVFQMDRGGFALNPRPIQLAEVIHKALHTLQPMFEPVGHQLSVQVPADLPVVMADRDQLGRVLVNLLLNAGKFTPAGGSIAVTAQEQAGEVVVSVQDTGVGIPPHEQAEAFLRFRRGGHAKRGATSGAGMGLAISKEVIERHHGWIDLTSEEGEGTTVSFGLPVPGL